MFLRSHGFITISNTAWYYRNYDYNIGRANLWISQSVNMKSEDNTLGASKEYIQFVLEQLDGIDGVTYKKMFGEYLVYVESKPILLVCDNCVMVKKAPELAEVMKDAPEGFPYDGAKIHYILEHSNYR